MASEECYCESYYRYTCPNCRERESDAGRARRPEAQSARLEVIVDSNPENNPPPITDGVWEGNDE